MKKDEMETTIVIDMTGKASVYTNMKGWVRELTEFTEKYDDCALTDIQRDSNGKVTGYFFEVPAKCICLRKRRNSPEDAQLCSKNPLV